MDISKLYKSAVFRHRFEPEFYAHQRVPFELAEKGYRNYLEDKSKEPPATWKEKGIGPTIGLGILGALFGAGAASKLTSVGGRILGARPSGSGALIGGALGAGLGALTGSVMKSVENEAIEEAKRILSSSDPDAVKLQLLRELVVADDDVLDRKAFIEESARERARERTLEGRARKRYYFDA